MELCPFEEHKVSYLGQVSDLEIISVEYKLVFHHVYFFSYILINITLVLPNPSQHFANRVFHLNDYTHPNQTSNKYWRKLSTKYVVPKNNNGDDDVT